MDEADLMWNGGLFKSLGLPQKKHNLLSI